MHNVTQRSTTQQHYVFKPLKLLLMLLRQQYLNNVNLLKYYSAICSQKVLNIISSQETLR